MTTNHDHDFHQLRGSFDRPVQPRTTFADALRRDLRETETLHGHAVSEPATHVVPQRVAPPRPLPAPRRREHPVWMNIAAALFVFVLIGAGWWNLADRGGDPSSELTRFAAMPESNASPMAEGTIADGTSVSMSRFGAIPSNEVIVTASHSLLFTMPMYAESGTLTARRAATGDALWTIPDLAVWDITATDAVVVIRTAPQTGATPDVRSTEAMSLSPGLVVADIGSGEVLWSIPALADSAYSAPTDDAFMTSAPVVTDEILAVANGIGNVRAWDLRTGQLRWSINVTTSSETSSIARFGQPFLAASGNSLIFIDGDGIAHVLHAADGTAQGTWTLIDAADLTDLAWLTLNDIQGHLFIQMAFPNRSVLKLLDPLTGTSIWERDVGGMSSLASWDDDNVAIVTTEWAEAPLISRILPGLPDGSTTAHLLVLEIASGAQIHGAVQTISESSYGLLLSIDEGIVCYAFATLSCTDNYGNSVMIDGLPESETPYSIWSITVVDGMLFVGTEQGVYAGDLQP